MAKLTNARIKKTAKLNSHLSSPFSICFKHKLMNGYTFEGLSARDMKIWQGFLDLASQMTFEQAERRYRRISDDTDTFDGEQIIHYAIGEAFRIHGVIENGQFVVLRMDPTHKFHR